MKKYILTVLALVAGMTTTFAQWNWGGYTGSNSSGRIYDADGNQIGTYSGTSGSKGNMVSYERTDTNTGWKYDNGTFVFKSEYVWTDFAGRIDVRDGNFHQMINDINEFKNYKDVVEFGYYRIVDGQATAALPMWSMNETGNITQNSVIFKEGETIGLYAKINEEMETGHYEETGHYKYQVREGRKNRLKTYYSDSPDGYVKDGKFIPNENGKWEVTGQKWVVDGTETVTKTYSTTDIDGATTVINNVDHDSRGEELQYFCMFDDGFGNVTHFEYYLKGLVSSSEGQSYEDFYNEVVKENGGGTNITNSDGTPADNNVGGQPLPGLLTTIALGGAAVAGISKKRKNRKA